MERGYVDCIRSAWAYRCLCSLTELMSCSGLTYESKKKFRKVREVVMICVNEVCIKIIDEQTCFDRDILEF